MKVEILVTSWFQNASPPWPISASVPAGGHRSCEQSAGTIKWIKIKSLGNLPREHRKRGLAMSISTRSAEFVKANGRGSRMLLADLSVAGHGAHPLGQLVPRLVEWPTDAWRKPGMPPPPPPQAVVVKPQRQLLRGAWQGRLTCWWFECFAVARWGPPRSQLQKHADRIIDLV